MSNPKWADRTTGRLDLERMVAERLGKTQEETAAVVRTLFNVMAEELVASRRIEIRRFGSFIAQERKARRAWNPRTGKVFDVPAKRVVKFAPGRQLAEAVIDDEEAA